MDKDKIIIADKPSALEQYKDFRDYLQKELSFYEYTNLHIQLGYSYPQKTARILNGHTPWTFNDIARLVNLFENPILPSQVIKHFKLNHNLSQFELNAIDSAVIGG